jgi:hypothetical protein
MRSLRFWEQHTSGKPVGRKMIPTHIFADPFLPFAGAKLEQVKGYAGRYDTLMARHDDSTSAACIAVLHHVVFLASQHGGVLSGENREFG